MTFKNLSQKEKRMEDFLKTIILVIRHSEKFLKVKLEHIQIQSFKFSIQN
ncbi:MAG: hypothetical protein HeimC3_16440 [Candidatus Heimdallarchaeota archaeon LC_3]|nr:MAG: hypothetical protein HeimC3_34860 [Candidatus Heimdallarchaeota archaeon LC_3]OLS25200.1 MAG: hypothetical protein HeimC3_16440 [Candidatus Heimdallarchaeota archaeon LC_3]